MKMINNGLTLELKKNEFMTGLLQDRVVFIDIEKLKDVRDG